MTKALSTALAIFFLTLGCSQQPPGPTATPTVEPTPTKIHPDPLLFDLAWAIVRHNYFFQVNAPEQVAGRVISVYDHLETTFDQPPDPFLLEKAWQVRAAGQPGADPLSHSAGQTGS